MSKPTFNPSFRWAIQTTGQMTSEAQRLLRQLLDIVWARTGLETSEVVTGTAGTSGRFAEWDANGDLIGSAAATGTGTPVRATAPTFTTSITIGGAAITVLDAGTYTPTLFNTTNVAASTAHVCTYLRLNQNVIVSGEVDIDVTAGATTTELGMSLPIASALSSGDQLGGTATAFGAAAISTYGITGDATNDRATISGLSSAAVANLGYGFMFMYRVL